MKLTARKMITHKAAWHMLNSKADNKDYGEGYRERYNFKNYELKKIVELMNSVPFMRHHITAVTIIPA
jgi:hypothetical protein